MNTVEIFKGRINVEVRGRTGATGAQVRRALIKRYSRLLPTIPDAISEVRMDRGTCNPNKLRIVAVKTPESMGGLLWCVPVTVILARNGNFARIFDRSLPILDFLYALSKASHKAFQFQGVRYWMFFERIRGAERLRRVPAALTTRVNAYLLKNVTVNEVTE